MRRSVFCHAILTVMLLHTVPVSGVGQVASTQEVPMDLVVALLDGERRGTNVFVGAVPAEAEVPIPLGEVERVVGGLVRGSGGTVVVEVAGDGPKALANYFEHLQTRGWARPSSRPSERGGFQTTSRYAQNVWCGEGYWIQGSSMNFDARIYLRISYTKREPGRSLCDPPEASAPSRLDAYGDLAFPPLEPPVVAIVQSGGGGGSSHGIRMEATIESDLGIEVIFEHYARQLTAAGWVPRGQAIGEGLAVGRWEARGAEGDPVVGTMSVWVMMDGQPFLASLRLDRPSPLW